ncbi:MAG TPA: alpha/beta hydrolase [Thermoanaerobaculia bacterium]|jgi:pimeloyl-ACP methyl ester carboxylesterase|nr:alpha/beta hydrolase [Thermoanaerobaculia bacterium]
MRIVGVVLTCLVLTGCPPRPGPMTVPIPSIRLAGAPGNRCFVVLLPGIGDGKEDFERQGFVRAFHDRGSPCELIALDSHFGYFANGSIVERLHDDVIAPARARGVERIWLVGISLGGLGAALYARDRPGEVDGLVLLSPYLGDDEILDEIEKAGGPRAWHPASAPGERDLRGLWVWLQGYGAPGAPRPLLWLGFGDSDRLRRGHRMLASLLPPERVLHTHGGHTWHAWRRLWRQVLATGALDGRGGAIR